MHESESWRRFGNVAVHESKSWRRFWKRRSGSFPTTTLCYVYSVSGYGVSGFTRVLVFADFLQEVHGVVLELYFVALVHPTQVSFVRRHLLSVMLGGVVDGYGVHVLG